MRVVRHSVQSDGEIPLGAAAEYFQIDGASGRHRTDGIPKRTPIDRLTVQSRDHIILAQAGFRSRTIRNNFGHNRALRCLYSERRGQLRSEFLEVNSQARTSNRAVLFQLGHDVTDQVYRNGEAYTLIPSAPGKNRCVDSDQLATSIDERAARVSGIDGGIGLDEVFIVFDSQPPATGGADDSHGHRLSEAKRITHRKRNVPDFDLRRIAQHHVRQISRIYLDQSNVGLGICSNDARLHLALVCHGDGQFRCAINDVVVCDDVAIRTNDHTRSFSLLSHGAIGHSESWKQIAERIVLRKLGRPDHLGG